MPFVLDASVTAAWAFEDEQDSLAGEALEMTAQDEAFTPALWWFEVRNTLVVNERRKRIHSLDTARFSRELARLPIRIDSAPDEAEVLRLARAQRLSVYDAVYLELAQRMGLPLDTLDRDLERAAKAERVTLVGRASRRR